MVIHWDHFADGKGDGNVTGHSVDTADSNDNISKAAKEIPLFTAEEEPNLLVDIRKDMT